MLAHFDGQGKPGAVPDSAPTADAAVDLREQLVNGGAVGPVGCVSLPLEMVTALRGILLDFDPDLFCGYRFAAETRADPGRFYVDVIRPLLERHPVFAKAEVRCSGRGLHAIVRFKPPVEFTSEHDRLRWAPIV